MINDLPLTLCLAIFGFAQPAFSAFPRINVLDSLSSRLLPSSSSNTITPRATPDNTTLWVIKDAYQGKTFFDDWEFFTGPDPTNGHVNYVDAATSAAKNLTYVTDDDFVIMRGDNETWLPLGTYRDSVRIKSNAVYNTGLFILDLNHAPWGCSVWPAFWTLGNGTWPLTGEIDIIEGVHDNQINQVAWHTAPGCTLDPNSTFTGNVVETAGTNNTNCDGNVNSNSGCAITEWSRASYGPYFDSQGGGVFVMKWDEEGISIWSFYRAAIPADITAGTPRPETWINPSAYLAPTTCDPLKYFVNHQIVFDITFCGDWAGNTYATSGCPGTCEDVLMDPRNYNNASWSINSLKVYSKTVLTGGLTENEAGPRFHPNLILLVGLLVLLGDIM